ncbi:MAG: hypothetical protein ACYDD1_05450 [Caulobacteraceae bacterium]
MWIFTAASWVWKLIAAAIGLDKPKPDPTAEQLAASNATAQTQLAQETADNETLNSAANARTDADARSVRNDPAAGVVDTNRSDPINTDPDAHFRD